MTHSRIVARLGRLARAAVLALAVAVACAPLTAADMQPPDPGACALASTGAAFTCRDDAQAPACVEAGIRAALACSPTPRA